jgi:SAM-dependent methyltransferase
MTGREDRGSWEDEAANWVAWARAPGHDVFPYFAPSFFDEILAGAGGRTLEIGCGEGRVARALVERGHRVVGIDGSRTLVRYARDADVASAYAVADGTALPFGDATFDTVVAYNALQAMAEMGDMGRAVREAGRVVKPSGHLCLCVAHPMTDIGRLKGVSPDGQITFAGSYFERERVNDSVTKDGLSMTFHGWTYTLEDYARALEGAGFVIERLREPIPGPEAAQRRDLRAWTRVPLFLSIRAVKGAR